MGRIMKLPPARHYDAGHQPPRPDYRTPGVAGGPFVESAPPRTAVTVRNGALSTYVGTRFSYCHMFSDGDTSSLGSRAGSGRVTPVGHWAFRGTLPRRGRQICVFIYPQYGDWQATSDENGIVSIAFVPTGGVDADAIAAEVASQVDGDVEVIVSNTLGDAKSPYLPRSVTPGDVWNDPDGGYWSAPPERWDGEGLLCVAVDAVNFAEVGDGGWSGATQLNYISRTPPEPGLPEPIIGAYTERSSPNSGPVTHSGGAGEPPAAGSERRTVTLSGITYDVDYPSILRGREKAALDAFVPAIGYFGYVYYGQNGFTFFDAATTPDLAAWPAAERMALCFGGLPYWAMKTQKFSSDSAVAAAVVAEAESAGFA